MRGLTSGGGRGEDSEETNKWRRERRGLCGEGKGYEGKTNWVKCVDAR